MRVFILGPGTRDTEAGVPPRPEALQKMLKFKEEITKAGVLQDGAGLQPTSAAKRVRFEGGQRTVIDGPFAESKELIAGYWIWQVRSMDEAVEWLKRAPFDGGTEVTIRPQLTWGEPQPGEGAKLRVMVFVPGNAESEAGVMPRTDLLEKMMKYNESLIQAGVMLDGQGLTPTSRARRVRFEGGKCTVIDGPFAEARELIAGFAVWQVASIEEAVEWVKRAPIEDGTEVTIRPFFEAEDFGTELTPELRAREEALARQMASQKPA